MSSGGYEASPLLSSTTQNDSRRTPSTLHSAYDRPLSLAPRRRSPSPGPSRRYIPHDSYVPPHAGPSYLDDYPNVYRPNAYRPDRSNTYYGRSPSPDRYGHSRGRESDPWDRIPWPASIKTPPWQDRRPVPASPPSASRDRVRGDTMMATRMFEPSDAWKQTHVDRPVRVEASRPSLIGRYSDNRIRDSRDLSPERSVRNDRSPPYFPVGGDRYRPGTNYREVYSNGRSEYDSYRPQYGDTWAPSLLREPPNVVDSYRRDPNSTPSARSSNHYDYIGRHTSSPDRSITGSVSPRSRPRTPPFRSRPRIPRRDTSRGRRSISYTDPSVHNSGSNMKPRTFADVDEPPQNNIKSRSSSRSSIASTHVSDNPPSPPRNDSPLPSQPQSNNTIPSGDPNPTAINESTLKENKLQHLLSPICPPKSPFSAVDTLHSTDHIKKQPPSCPASLDLDTEKRQKSDADTSVHTLPPQPLPVVTNASKVLSKGESNATNGIHKQSTLLLQTSPSDPKSDSPLSQSFKSSLVPTAQPSGNFSSLTAKHHGHDNIRESRLPASSTEIPTSPDQPPALQAEKHLPSAFPTIWDSQLSTPVDVKESVPTTPFLLTEPVVDPPPQDIPRLSDAKSTAEALRIVVMTRLLCDRQTREERVNPVLMANLSITRLSDDRTSTTADDLITDFSEGKRVQARMDSFASTKQSLVKRFTEHQAAIAEKARRLREEYVSLHERWLTHCAALHDQAKPGASESEAVPTSGRTTRRSTAIGDAVRSDLEMEQIIASLGNDELTDPSQLSARNLAVIPDMISVTHGQVDYVYDDTNHLLTNPGDFYGPHTGIHDWTEEEKEIFLDKFAAYPKQFGIIADYLPNKTPSQCVDFYYLHKKVFIDFRKVVSQYAPNKRRRRRTDKQKGNGLLADIRQHDAEVHRDSTSTNGRTTRGRNGMPPPIAEPRRPASSRRAAVHLGLTPTSTPTPEPEARPRRARGTQLSRRTVSVSQDDGEEHSTDAEPRAAKRVKRARKSVRSAAVVLEEPATLVTETKFIDQTESTNRRKPLPLNIQWSDEDKNLFLALLAQHGDDFKRIAASMPNKTTIQVNNYYKSNLIDLNLEQVAAGAPKRSPTPEPRDSWNDISHYPGSGIMSPVSGSAPDTAPAMSSLETLQPNGGVSPPRRMQIHELLSVSSGGGPRSPPTSWPSSTGVEREMTGPSGIRPRVSEPAMQYNENTGDGADLYSSSQACPRLPAAYPLPIGRPSSGSYAPASVPPPSFAPIQTKPLSYSQSMFSYDSRQGPPSSSIFETNSTSHPASHHPPSIASSNRGENPYPVMAASRGASSSFFFS